MTDSVVPPSTSCAQAEAKRLFIDFVTGDKPIQMSACPSVGKVASLTNFLCSNSGRLPFSTCDVRPFLAEIISKAFADIRAGVQELFRVEVANGKWRFIPNGRLELAR